jgi:hypothetical protein
MTHLAYLYRMADITYNTSSFLSLIRTISNLAQLSMRPPLLLLGYKEHDAGERTLWDMARDIGVVFKRVGERHGSGGAPVKIWIETAGVSLVAAVGAERELGCS